MCKLRYCIYLYWQNTVANSMARFYLWSTSDYLLGSIVYLHRREQWDKRSSIVHNDKIINRSSCGPGLAGIHQCKLLNWCGVRACELECSVTLLQWVNVAGCCNLSTERIDVWGDGSWRITECRHWSLIWALRHQIECADPVDPGFRIRLGRLLPPLSGPRGDEIKNKTEKLYWISITDYSFNRSWQQEGRDTSQHGKLL